MPSPAGAAPAGHGCGAFGSDGGIGSFDFGDFLREQLGDVQASILAHVAALEEDNARLRGAAGPVAAAATASTDEGRPPGRPPGPRQLACPAPLATAAAGGRWRGEEEEDASAASDDDSDDGDVVLCVGAARGHRRFHEQPVHATTPPASEKEESNEDRGEFDGFGEAPLPRHLLNKDGQPVAIAPAPARPTPLLKRSQSAILRAAATGGNLAAGARMSAASEEDRSLGQSGAANLQQVSFDPASNGERKRFKGFMANTLGYGDSFSDDGSEYEITQSNTLKRENIVYVGGIPNASLGALRGIIETARNGKATRKALLKDTRSFWERWRTFIGDWFLATVIILNTMTIGIAVEVDNGWSGWLFIDGVFALIFLIEMVVKMYVLGIHQYFLGTFLRFNFRRDAELRWRLFEFMLVVLAWLEILVAVADLASAGGSNDKTSGPKLGLFRILRLTRIARILRVCRLQIFSDLLMMINGAIGGMRTLLWSMVLIALPLYAVALLLREALRDMVVNGNGAETFATLPIAWFTMFRCIVAQECTTVDGKPIFVLITEQYGWEYGALYAFTVVLMSFGLFNVITALYVENTVAAAKYNNLHQKRQRLLDAQMFAEKTTQLVEFVWRVYTTNEMQRTGRVSSVSRTSSSGSRWSIGSLDMGEISAIQITPQFFDELRAFKEFQDILTDLDVSDEDQLDLFDTLDVDGGGTIDLEELVVGICKLRGDARRSDIVGVGLIVRSIQMALTRFEEQTLELLQAQEQAFRCMQEGRRLPSRYRSRRQSRVSRQSMGSADSIEDPSKGQNMDAYRFQPDGFAGEDGASDRASGRVSIGDLDGELADVPQEKGNQAPLVTGLAGLGASALKGRRAREQQEEEAAAAEEEEELDEEHHSGGGGGAGGEEEGRPPDKP